MPENEGITATGQGVLNKRLGPFRLWQWGVLGASVGAVYLFLRNRSSASSLGGAIPIGQSPGDNLGLQLLGRMEDILEFFEGLPIPQVPDDIPVPPGPPIPPIPPDPPPITNTEANALFAEGGIFAVMTDLGRPPQSARYPNYAERGGGYISQVTSSEWGGALSGIIGLPSYLGFRNIVTVTDPNGRGIIPQPVIGTGALDILLNAWRTRREAIINRFIGVPSSPGWTADRRLAEIWYRNYTDILNEYLVRTGQRDKALPGGSLDPSRFGLVISL